jgi:LysM repeat protein
MYGTVTSSSAGVSRAERQMASPPPPAAAPFRYTVQEGDSLARVAAKTGSTEQALMALNPLLVSASASGKKRVRLYPGQQLVVDDARRVSLPPPPDCIDAGWGQMHVVRAGEALRDIAAQYNTTEELLRQDNRRFFPAGERGVLEPGQLLHVRIFNSGEMEPDTADPNVVEDAAVAAPPSAAASYSNSSAKFARYKTHVVDPSDTFASLCAQYEISYPVLLQLNRGRFPVGKRADLAPGEPLIVPDLEASREAASRRHIAEVKLTKQIHVVEAGETPHEIAARYGMTYDEIREFNRAYFPKGFRGEIRPGYKLVVKRLEAEAAGRSDGTDVRRDSGASLRDAYMPIGGEVTASTA